MLDPSVQNELMELIAVNFKADEIDALGQLLFKTYNSHTISGTSDHFTLSPRKCAQLLVQHSAEENTLLPLVKLVAEMDEGLILGRKVQVDGLEPFLHHLVAAGYIYDFKKRKIHSLKGDPGELLNWGSLKNGKTYSMTVMSLDIVDNSTLVRKYGNRKIGKLYNQFRLFLRERTASYDGRIWNLAGDGGLIAFTFKNHADRAVRCALEIQSTLPLFILESGIPFEERMSLRIGLHTGKVVFQEATGSIVSDVINYACHLEKKVTDPGKVAISEAVHSALSPKTSLIFSSQGNFEDIPYFSTPNRMDAMYYEACV